MKPKTNSIVFAYAFNERGKIEEAKQFANEEEVKTFLRNKYSGVASFGIHGLTQTGHFREMAIDYNFTPFLKKYLVEEPSGHYHAAYAPTKGHLRKVMCLAEDAVIYDFPTLKLGTKDTRYRDLIKELVEKLDRYANKKGTDHYPAVKSVLARARNIIEHPQAINE